MNLASKRCKNKFSQSYKRMLTLKKRNLPQKKSKNRTMKTQAQINTN